MDNFFYNTYGGSFHFWFAVEIYELWNTFFCKFFFFYFFFFFLSIRVLINTFWRCSWKMVNCSLSNLSHGSFWSSILNPVCGKNQMPHYKFWRPFKMVSKWQMLKLWLKKHKIRLQDFYILKKLWPWRLLISCWNKLSGSIMITEFWERSLAWSVS